MDKTLVKLGDLIEQIRGVSYKPTDLHNNLDENSVTLLRANNINDGKLNFDDVVYVDKNKVKKEQYLKKGDIFICASSGSKELVGKATYINKDLEAVFGAFCKVVRLKNKDYAQYVGHYFNSPVYRTLVNNASQGSNINNLRNEDIEELEINWVENLSDQHKIVATLDQVNDLISLRNQQLEQLDLLIKSRFVEMFGDPVNNDKDWESKKLKEICNKITDGTHDTPKRVKDGYLLITGKNIRSSGIIFDEIEYVSSNDHKTIYARCNPEYGDVLYTNIGVNFCTACFNNLNYEFSMKNVALLKPNKAILNGKYLCLTLNLLRNKIVEKNKVGGAQTFLGLATIKMIEVPLPPLDLLTLFAAFVEEVERTKATVKQSLEWLNTLKEKLMQDFFG